MTKMTRMAGTILTVLSACANGHAQSPVATGPSGLPQGALLEKYCAGCHNQKLNSAGVSFDRVDVAKPGDNAGVWEKSTAQSPHGPDASARIAAAGNCRIRRAGDVSRNVLGSGRPGES